MLIQGCKQKSNKSDFPSAGTITYVIDYPKTITDSPTGSLMPRKLKLTFKDNKTHYSFKASFNVFSLDFYSSSNADSCTTLFHFMDKNLLHVGTINSTFFFFDKEVKPTIELNENETKEIAGVQCYQALIKFENQKQFLVYYTKSIDLKQPNRHTHLNEIPGVLMDFYVDYNNVRFHFTADKIDYEIPPQSMFEVPNSAKRTQKEEIESLINTLIKNFQ